MLRSWVGVQGGGVDQKGPFYTPECGSAALQCEGAWADVVLCSCPLSFRDDKRENLRFIKSGGWR